MKILYHNRRSRPEIERELDAQYSSLDALLTESDFVTLHAPFTPQTEHMIAAPQLAKMKPSAVLVNTSRGALVDQRALYEALSDHRIFAAALDVTETEPIISDDPLLSLNNVIIAPHIASATVATRRRMAMMAAENLIDGISGRLPANCVNPESLR